MVCYNSDDVIMLDAYNLTYCLDAAINPLKKVVIAGEPVLVYHSTEEG